MELINNDQKTYQYSIKYSINPTSLPLASQVGEERVSILCDQDDKGESKTKEEKHNRNCKKKKIKVKLKNDKGMRESHHYSNPPTTKTEMSESK